MARIRSTKWLAQRIQVMYYKDSHWLRTLRHAAVWGGFVLALLWVGAAAVWNDQRIYAPGPVASSHALIEERCELCHSAAGKLAVGDANCIACHRPQEAPHGYSGERHLISDVNPACGECHADHHGRDNRLIRVVDERCTYCHADLTALRLPAEAAREPGAASIQSEASGGIAPRVASFARGEHPEFRFFSAGGELVTRDATRVALNHEMHLDLEQLREELLGHPIEPVNPLDPEDPLDPKRFEERRCGDCHAPDLRGALMRPIRFDSQCASCHRLVYDHSVANLLPREDAVVPHGLQPEEIDLTLRARYAEALRLDPDVWKLWRDDEVRLHLGCDTMPSAAMGSATVKKGQSLAAPSLSPEAWTDRRLCEVERILFRKTCRQCHSLEERASAVLRIEKTDVPAQWMPHSAFDHKAHVMFRCESCHGEEAWLRVDTAPASSPVRTRTPAGPPMASFHPVETSRDSADILIPPKAICDTCHHPSGATVACAACHRYHHDPLREGKPWPPGTLNLDLIRELLGEPAKASS